MLISNSTTPTIRAQYEYDPFGRIQTQSGTLATANTHRFSSKRHESQ
jgi:YD repeat-containing protein